MEVVFEVGILWLVFGASHIGLTTASVRDRLVALFGERSFVLAYSAVSFALFALLVTTYADVRLEGPPGPHLGRFPVAREIAVIAIVAGVVLMAASFARYPQSPFAGFGERPFAAPQGVQRITRHAFFVGLVVFSLAHALLATRLVGAVFVAGFAAVSIAGTWHQDRKLLRRLGPRFGGYLEETSAVPFVAIAKGRQTLVWSELPYGTMAIGLGLAFVLRRSHEWIFAFNGAPFIVATLVSVLTILVTTIRRELRVASEAADGSLQTASRGR